MLNNLISGILSNGGEKVLSGDDAFKLNDTFGFPLDLTVEIAGEKGIKVDVERFNECLQIQKDTARKDRNSKVGSSWDEGTMGNLDLPKTDFTGYKSMSEDNVKIIGMFKDGESVTEITEGDDAIIILDRTPFYAESGGQTGDKGVISIGESDFVVSDTKKVAGGQFIHIGYVDAGTLSIGNEVTAKIDKTNRLSTMRNHSCAHLLQAALREVLGTHVHQAGQLVDSQRLRFDFSHFSAVTPEELAKVESIVNNNILSGIPITMTEMPIEDARKLGAMALFGEKYGNIVRVVKMGDASLEFCGGTHLDNTAKIGLFRIISEASVAAGVRRIEAVTGTGVLELINNDVKLIHESASALKLANAHELPSRCHAVMAEIKELEKQVDEATQSVAQVKLGGMAETAVDVSGVKVMSAFFNPIKSEALRSMCDMAKEKFSDYVTVLAGVNGNQGTFAISCGKNAVAKGAHAGKIVQKVAAITDGKGGGRPDSAMAGIGDKFKVDEALAALPEIIKEFIK